MSLDPCVGGPLGLSTVQASVNGAPAARPLARSGHLIPLLVLFAIDAGGVVVPAYAAAGGGMEWTENSAAPSNGYVAVMEARFDRSRKRLEELSLALRAAVGDPTEYRRLRLLHDREVEEYEAVRQALYHRQPRH